MTVGNELALLVATPDLTLEVDGVEMGAESLKQGGARPDPAILAVLARLDRTPLTVGVVI